jgi:hypothetical protein
MVSAGLSQGFNRNETQKSGVEAKKEPPETGGFES